MNSLGTLAEGIRIAWDALRENRIRTGLTILGVAIGVSVVVTMAALVTGIRSSVVDAVESVGPENFYVTPFDFTDVRLVNDGGGRPPWWGRPEISDAEVRGIEALPGVREAIITHGFSLAVSSQGGLNVEGIQGQGASPEWPSATQGVFTAGRNFTPAENREARPVVILSSGLADALFEGTDPIGKTVRAQVGTRTTQERLTVLGVFEAEENIFAGTAPQFAIVPHATAVKRLKALSPFSFGTITVIPEPGYGREAVQDQVIGLLRGMRGLRPVEENNFAIVRSDQLMEMFDQLTGVFFMVMIALSSVGLMVGGVGVIGIMLISVTERTREIGIRKALGATQREILWQFLVEASVLTLVGGAVGMIFGAFLAFMVDALTPIPAAIPLWSIVAALSAAILTGLLFGLLPAIRAARMEPVAALRFE